MPHPGEAKIETISINSWLENHVSWPLLCIVPSAMRTRLSGATTRVKEVREFPIGVVGRGLKVGYAEYARCFERHNHSRYTKER
jgi:hypothetical protein